MAQSIRSARRVSAIYSPLWNTRVSTIARRYDLGQPEHHIREEPALIFAPHVLEWVEFLSGQIVNWDTRVRIEPYARQYGKLGREVWSEVALWLLCHDKERLIDFLVATHIPLYPPINWIEGALAILARHYSMTHMRDDLRARRMQKLIDAFAVLLDRETKEQYIFDGSFMRRLLPFASHHQVLALYSSIKQGRAKVHPNTLLHFAEYFAKSTFIEQSLDALLESHKAGADIDSLQFRKGCSTLLRKSLEHPGRLRVCLRLIENLASLGVKLNRHMCNIVMLNAVESGDIDTMDAVHRSAIDQGLEPNAHTCAIRLKACKTNIADADRLKAVIQDTIENGDVRRNDIVATELIHCLALHHAEHSPKAAFATVRAAYLQLFDPSPLQRLGIPMPELGSSQRSTAQRLQPPPHVTGFMVALYIKEDNSGDSARQLYTRWRELVEAGDVPLVQTAKTPHLSNIFLKRFCAHKSLLLDATKVVKDMQRGLPDTAGVQQAPPSIYTWSIFLDGFARRGETKLAEQVLSYMQDRGMEPNIVTWTSLLGGYTSADDSEGAVDTIRRMDQAGAVWNQWTMGAVRGVKNKQKLHALLQRQKYEKALDFRDELKQGLMLKLSDPSMEAAQVKWEGSSERPANGQE